MVRDGISREEAYGLPRKRAAKPTRLAWRGAFSRSTRVRPDTQIERDTKPLPNEPTHRAFVAPPWRFADWSFAVLAGIAGLFTALAVFVLIGTRGAPREALPTVVHVSPLRSEFAPGGAAKAKAEHLPPCATPEPDAPAAEPSSNPTPTKPPAEHQAEAKAEAQSSTRATERDAPSERRHARRERHRSRHE
jgi:hypothetical protein